MTKTAVLSLLSSKSHVAFFMLWTKLTLRSAFDLAYARCLMSGLGYDFTDPFC